MAENPSYNSSHPKWRGTELADLDCGYGIKAVAARSPFKTGRFIAAARPRPGRGGGGGGRGGGGGGGRRPRPGPGRAPDPRRRALLGSARGGHLRAHDRPG